jgi:hypothetical protein
MNEERKEKKADRGEFPIAIMRPYSFFSRRQTWNNYFHIVVERKEIDVVIMTHTQHSMNIRFFFRPHPYLFEIILKQLPNPPAIDFLKSKGAHFSLLFPKNFHE